MFELKLGEGFEAIVDWMQDNLDPLFDGIAFIVRTLIDGIETALIILPPLIMILVFMGIGAYIAGKKVGVLTGIGLFIIYSLGYWEDTMTTLSMVLVSSFIALLIGVPTGILSAKNEKANVIIRPILDFMQTMPAYVYLIPAVLFFNLGTVPGIIATIIFSMPPAVRLTNLGIRQVPVDVVEAGRSFGATSRQLLMKIQMPLAIPTILAGMNQTIMLALSMVVISAMIGAKGLGLVVYNGITQLKIGQGFESGLSIVILAMILDRVTQSIGQKKNK